MKKILLAVAVTVIAVFGNQSVVRAQSFVPITQSQYNNSSSAWSFAWGSDASIIFRTNGVSTGFTGGPQMIAGGASYTSDVWTMNLTFNSGNVAITANSAQGGSGLYWTLNYSLNPAVPINNILFGTLYQANNGESMSIGSIEVNGIPVSGTALANGSQSFGGGQLSYGSPITSVQFQIDIATSSSWQRQTVSGPPYGPALLDEFSIETAPVPEPSTMVLSGVGGAVLLVSLIRKKT